MGNFFTEKKYIGPEFDLKKMVDLTTPGEYLWAPNAVRNVVGGDASKQAWAGKLTQAGLYAALLASLGYGSRKLLRGTTQETQDALDAIDKYLDSSYDPIKEGDKELVNKEDYNTPGKQLKESFRRMFSKGASDINAFSYLIPPGAAVMGWMVGQKMAEQNIKNGDLRKSKARLAKARADYDRTLALKLDPNANVPEKVPVKHLESPIDWTIDKGIEMKKGFFQNIRDRIAQAEQRRKAKALAKQQAKDAAAAAAEEAPKEAAEEPLDIRPVEHFGPDTFQGKLINAMAKTPSVVGGFLGATAKASGLQPYLMMLGALAFLGAGKYAWNNEVAVDKGRQAALDKEAAIKHMAAQRNDQRIDLGRILPGSTTKTTTGF